MYDSSILFLDSSRRIRLRDGSRCRIRPVSGVDRHLLVDCFTRLSPNSRRLRFFSVKPRLSQKDLDFFSNADGFDHIALVAVRLNIFGEEQEALGFARCIRLEQAPESAEMSLAVADEVQRLGVGSALLDRLSGLARSAGIRRFVCEVLAENRGMRTLAKRMGGAAHWQGDGTVLYDWSLTEAARTEAAGLPAESGGDLGISVELWMAIITHAVRIGIDQYDAIVRRFLPPSFTDVQYVRRWAQ